MKNQHHGFEIEDVLKQFVSAFNSIVINRYNKNRVSQDQIQANFVYAPKERVLHDLVNKNQHIKLPVIAVYMTGISRDNERSQNKLEGYYISKAASVSAGALDTNYMPSPVPVNINVSMDILTRHQSDMDQILGNFIPYTDPYIYISWKVPDSQNLLRDQEIRSKVVWDGSVNLAYPTDISGTEPYRVSASTSFTIESFLFKKNGDPNVGNIFTVDSNFIPVSGFSYE